MWVFAFFLIVLVLIAVMWMVVVVGSLPFLMVQATLGQRGVTYLMALAVYASTLWWAWMLQDFILDYHAVPQAVVILAGLGVWIFWGARNIASDESWGSEGLQDYLRENCLTEDGALRFSWGMLIEVLASCVGLAVVVGFFLGTTLGCILGASLLILLVLGLLLSVPHLRQEAQQARLKQQRESVDASRELRLQRYVAHLTRRGLLVTQPPSTSPPAGYAACQEGHALIWYRASLFEHCPLCRPIFGCDQCGERFYVKAEELERHRCPACGTPVMPVLQGSELEAQKRLDAHEEQVLSRYQNNLALRGLLNLQPGPSDTPPAGFTACEATHPRLWYKTRAFPQGCPLCHPRLRCPQCRATWEVDWDNPQGRICARCGTRVIDVDRGHAEWDLSIVDPAQRERYAHLAPPRGK